MRARSRNPMEYPGEHSTPDPRRSAILLIGGDKTGNDRWYEEFVPVADRLYDDHIEQLRKEGLTEDG